jgi:hypothetical protein
MGAGRNAVEPKEFVKQAKLERRVEIPVGRRPKKADDDRPLQQGYIDGKTKRGKKNKKKATPKTCSRISA